MFQTLLRAGRILQVDQLTDLTAAYEPDYPFSLYLVPASGSDVEMGDTVIVNAKLPYGSAAGDVPVAVGDWSPVVFEKIAASGIDLTAVDAYVAPIKID